MPEMESGKCSAPGQKESLLTLEKGAQEIVLQCAEFAICQPSLLAANG